MCRRNICSIPLEVFLRPTRRFSPLRPALLSLSLLRYLSFSRISSSGASRYAAKVLDLPSLHGRQVYFYSIRFIRLNMTCGYSSGDIFPILRDDIPTPVVPRVSCILCPYRSFLFFLPACSLSLSYRRQPR